MLLEIRTKLLSLPFHTTRGKIWAWKLASFSHWGSSFVFPNAFVRNIRKLPRGVKLTDAQKLRLQTVRDDKSLTLASRAIVLVDTQLSVLGPDDDLRPVWQNVYRLSKLRPTPDEARKLLPTLLSLAGTNDKALVATGEFAYAANALDALTGPARQAYGNHLKDANPYRAIELWRQFPADFGAVQAASFYIAANQVHKAEKLAEEFDVVPMTLIRELITVHCRSGNVDQVQHWINRWQALTPEDVRWLRHTLQTHKIPVPDSVPPTDTKIPSPWRASHSVLNLIGAANKAILSRMDVLEDAVTRKLWEKTVATPSKETVTALIKSLVLYHHMTKLLPLLSFEEALHVLAEDVELSPKAYAECLRKARSKQQVEAVLQHIPLDNVYSHEVLGALGTVNPAALLELSVPLEFVPSSEQEHLMLAYWRALGHSETERPDITTWLLPSTIKGVKSHACLRAACIYCIRFKQRETLRNLFQAFSNKGLHIDERLVHSLQEYARTGKQPQLKLGKPVPTKHPAEAQNAYESLVQYL